MAQYTHIQELLDFHGLDLRSSELLRPRGFATSGSQNQQHSAQGAIKTRNGSKVLADVIGQTGLVRFDTTSMTGVAKSEIIGFGTSTLSGSETPYKLIVASFTLTNSHATLPATVTHFYDTATSQFRFIITRGGVAILNQALGTGLEGSPYVLSTLETAVDAVTSFAMSTPANGSGVAAAWIELLTGLTVAAASGTATVYYYYWQAIDAVLANVYATAKNASYEIGSATNLYQNVSTATVRGSLYISSGANSPASSLVNTAVISKYDGQDFYRSGFDRYFSERFVTQYFGVSVPASRTDSKGTRTHSQANPGTFSGIITAIRVDKAGNKVESIAALTHADLGTIAAGDGIRISISTSSMFTAANGFGLRQARVNGVMTSTLSITVDAGHNMTMGSIAYFWDTIQSRFIQREVLSIGATTLTISTSSLDNNTSSINYDLGGVVSTFDNASITNNIRIGIYRTVDAVPNVYYLVDERPYSTFAETILEYDDSTDSTLGAQYVEPAYPHDAPPQGRFLCSFNDQLIVTGDDLNPNTVYFSDEGPEYFPKNTHEFDLPAKVTGAHQTSEVLACATKNSLHVVSGDLLNFAFRVNRIGNNIGVTSHASMQEAMEGYMMFASYKGPYVLIGGRDLKPLGAVTDPLSGKQYSRLEPYFTALYGPSTEKPVFEHCTSGVLPNDSLYVLYVPSEIPTLPAFGTTNSLVFVYNYNTDSWYKWTGINMDGGMAVLDDQLMFTSRAYDGAGGPSLADVKCYLQQQQKRKDQYNFADHNVAIPFIHKTHWESLNKPGLFKRYLRTKIYSHETREASTCALTVKTYVDFDPTALSFTNVLTWTTQKSITTKIKAETCRAIMHSFESSEYYKPQVISGFELEAVANFRPEFKE